MSIPPSPSRDISQLSMFETLELGIKTLFSEWKWIIISRLRKMEIRQMKRRLDQEYLVIGKLEIEGGGGSERMELSRRQISFLQQEIVQLELELDKTRQDFIAKRIDRWNLA
jgi:hypothetical protein